MSEQVSAAAAWRHAARPHTLGASIVPIVVGTALAARAGSVDVIVATRLCFAYTLLQIASNFINDAADHQNGADGPERIGFARAAARGWLSARRLYLGAAVCITGFLFLVLPWLQEGSWLIRVGAATCVYAAVCYTAGPRPLGYRGLGDLLVMLYFGFVPVAASLYVQNGALSPAAWSAAFALGGLSTAILVVNNLRDRKNDEATGKRTMVVRFGQRFGQIEYTLCIASAFGLCVTRFLQEHDAAWLFPLALLPLALRAIVGIWNQDGQQLNLLLKRTAQLGVAYGMLLTAGLLALRPGP